MRKIVNMEEIVKIRKGLGKTQDEMAHYIGISRPSYILIEQGKSDITVFQAAIMAELLDIHYLDFMKMLVPEVLNSRL